jgi:hypothetical protein
LIRHQLHMKKNVFLSGLAAVFVLASAPDTEPTSLDCGICMRNFSRNSESI